MIVNFAERAPNHSWELDPFIRSLLGKHYPKTRMKSH